MKKHIMFIADDKTELDYFMTALREVPEDDGFKLTHAGSISQATEMLRLLVPHYIFIDKCFDSADFIRHVKNHKALGHVKIFIYQGNKMVECTQSVTRPDVAGWVHRSDSSWQLGQNLANCFA
jgi:hypothetical protein